jgi:glutamate/aspartate transport system permease protein
VNYHWNWGIFLAPALGSESYLDWLLSGLGITALLGLTAWMLALLLGSVLGLLQTWPSRWIKAAVAVYVEVFRGIPLLVQIFIWYFAMPEVLPYGERLKALSPFGQQFIAAFLCLGTYTAARVCVQVRAGIDALPRGQRNAGLALGFSQLQTYRYVLLPQAFRIIVPPLTSEFLSIFKNTAVASTIGLLELASQGRQLVDYTAQPYEAFIAVTTMYLLINMTVMLLMHWVEARTALPGGRASGPVTS